MAKKKSKVAKMKASKPKPRQKSLPGMEDRAIAELEGLAEQYADVRDKRMALTIKETQHSRDLLAAMKKRGKTEYHHGEINIWVRTIEEKVRVKIGEMSLDEMSPEPGPSEVPAEAEVDVEVPAFDEDTDGADSEDEEIPGAVGA